MSLFDIIYCTALILFFVVVLTSLFYEKRTKIVPAPTFSWVRNKALSLIPSHFSKEGQYEIVDLGCGWGGALIALYKIFPHSKITGYEMSFWPYLVSKTRTLLRENILIFREDFFKKDISSSDIIFCYLSPYHMELLKEKLSALRQGSCVVSCSFPILGWTADKVVYVNCFIIKIPVYSYIIGEQLK